MTPFYLYEIAITGIFDDLIHMVFDVVLYYMITRLYLMPLIERKINNG
jgi:hypothetical protein|tara:strand:- start:12249 stop:12392 length:144 start_codon:yes stop_codon:yes gene_type:complete